MQIVLLTVAELAKRWQVNERTIRKYIEDGTLTPCKNVPGVRFNPIYIEELEGIDVKKHSEFEFRTLQKEIAQLRKEKAEMQEIIREYQVLNAKSLFILA
ncbi:hypothetical protein CBU02nite_32670 [Clostridium butyricum]|uniref:HTH merR-type domain-containing protein n=1 Tax=Clostridium butyricum TaxID=1492 RepID=A0A512TRN5_CLOBU|nr:helix-turn-helix domain-containing protein [Clostridium butyricum]NOW22146.1 putative site-specific integrase-resolvase [Clostridium butyricum]GEQ22761.1 hypothetical protein CBU02nite_32670 [Clostridium butyricum]